MADQNQIDDQISFLLTDFNTRLRDLEERNKLIKDRTLLLGKNLIEAKEQIDSELLNLKRQTNQMQKDLEKIKSLLQNLVSETDNFVRRDEMLLIERMLKDFQPMEFVRMEDLREALKNKRG